MVGPKSEKYLGFALKDPVGFRANQTAFQRFTSWQNGLSTEYHITVPQSVLRSTTVETLSEQAQALHLSTHAEVT